ncbi:MAG: MerC family mercury resistance protein [Rhodospirillaceae bacterium]|nr:MerC family mercury resistance protein [Rhodospirillaceae bacterium]MBT5456188.1 MerC family mercury resistance protein [Rhodospirillaceae bacterium]
MAHAVETARSVFRFGWLAYFGAAVSLIFCFWKATFSLIAPILGLTFIEINPHLQAATMWLSAAFTVGALFLDRRQHGQSLPFLTGIVGLLVIMATLYTLYHDAILATGYVLLLIAAFLNQNRMLACLNQRVELQAQDLAEINESLERRVAEQVEEIGHLARLKRFLPSEVANLITAEGNESLLDSHRRYISCLFCDIRRFTSMTDSMEPEDVMDVLRSYHERVGQLVVQYSGTIGYRAGDGVMVFFNDPIPCDDPDFRAIRLAFDLQKNFAALCGEWTKLGVDVGLGVGIASGYATMGVIGVEGRFDYTPFGNTVNLSARLCDRAQDGEILISNRTRAEVEEQVISQPAGTLSLKGIAQPVEAFLLKGMKEDSTVVSAADS